MSSFTTPVDLRMLDDYKWQLLSDVVYHVGASDSNNIITAPKGSVTDLASVPRALWSIFPPHGKYAKAAIIHDYLYTNAIGTKAYADQVFLEAMKVLKVPKWRRTLMYLAVKWRGKGNY